MSFVRSTRLGARREGAVVALGARGVVLAGGPALRRAGFPWLDTWTTLADADWALLAVAGGLESRCRSPSRRGRGSSCCARWRRSVPDGPGRDVRRRGGQLDRDRDERRGGAGAPARQAGRRRAGRGACAPSRPAGWSRRRRSASFCSAWSARVTSGHTLALLGGGVLLLAGRWRCSGGCPGSGRAAAATAAPGLVGRAARARRSASTSRPGGCSGRRITGPSPPRASR